MVPWNIFRYCWVRNGHHWNRLICREPIRFIISTSIITYIIEVAEKEWHCVKSLNTRACRTCEKRIENPKWSFHWYAENIYVEKYWNPQHIHNKPRSWWWDFSFPSRYNNEYPSHSNTSSGSQRGITEDWLCLTSILPVVYFRVVSQGNPSFPGNPGLPGLPWKRKKKKFQKLANLLW